MDSLDPPFRFQRLVNVKNISLNDDGSTISWESAECHAITQARITELVFILDLSARPGKRGYIVIILLEQGDDALKTFDLLSLRADEVPQALHGHCITSLPEHLIATPSNHVDVIISTKSGVGLSLNFWSSVLQPLWALVEQHLGPLSPQPSSTSTPAFSAPLPVWDRHAHAPSAAGPSPSPSPLALGLVTLFTGAGAQLPVFRASFSPGSLLVHQPAPPARPVPVPVPAGTSGSSSSSSHVEAGIGAPEKDGDALAADGLLPVEHLYGAVVASYGFHASIVYESDTPAYRAHGDKRFNMVAQDLLRESHAYLAAVRARRPREAEEQQQQGQQGQLDGLAVASRDPLRHGYVLVTPLSNLERAFAISPASRPLDGKLRLVHFGDIGGARTMDVMMAAYDAGRHVGMRWNDGEAVLYQEVDEVEVETLEEDARWRKVCIDGTIVELPRGGRFSVRKDDRRIFDVLVRPEVLPAAAAAHP
ncbi:hypothetical protein ESCO_002953 [Escovopsis weberi]|uniref:Uncharacterized protein n=1 Tax=Escovopsis weberi TaxID=150374 RepID=A0A0M8N0X0_ESCWE|nr:hypothetical protein ESCO_002953 [Escovopsis weberi]